MKAFARKQGQTNEPLWRSDPMTSAQQWRIEKEREEMKMPPLTEYEVASLDKGKASDMLSELIALRELQNEEVDEKEISYMGVDEDFRPESPWERL